MIEIRHVSKRFGDLLAVDNLSFTVHPGRVTGFLGPNGAGKSTTMRMIVGLDRPTQGRVLVNGRAYTDHPVPLAEVGALLEAKAVHPGRSARDHLRAVAATSGISRARVEQVIELVGLSQVASKRSRTFSLGMQQRLGIASALLGDPQVIMLDEPVNGLDPDGIHWIRGLLRVLAGEGRTVFISSHLMSEIALTADQVVIVGRGRLIADVSMTEMLNSHGGAVRVRSPQVDVLRTALRATGAPVEDLEPGLVLVRDRTPDQVAELAFAERVLLHELTPVHSSLEDAYLALTRDDIEYRAAPTTDSRRAA